MKTTTAAISHDERLKAFLENQGYFNVRILPDGMICNLDMIFTRSLIINPDWCGHEKRYCYEDRQKAVEACDKMQSVDDEPLPGYTAVKGYGI